MKQCIALRHVPFESLGLLEPLLVDRGFEVKTVDVPVEGFDGAATLDAELVVVLGGPISAYEEHLYPFLTAELALLERRLHDERPTVGICLGAQLMARALGARVYPGVSKEIGWEPLILTPSGARSALGAIDGMNVLHWHGDTFDLPEGADLLASTTITPHQAFNWRGKALALQFHLEVSATALEGWYVGHALELSRWGGLSIPELRANGQRSAPMLEPHAQRAFRSILDVLLA